MYDRYDLLRDQIRLISIMHAARGESLLTQEELAKRIGVKQEFISRIELGEENPTYKTLCKIAKAVGKQVDFVRPQERKYL